MDIILFCKGVCGRRALGGQGRIAVQSGGGYRVKIRGDITKWRNKKRDWAKTGTRREKREVKR